MSTVQVQRVLKKHIQPQLGGFQLKGRLLYAAPLGDVLRGLYFETSAYDSLSFCVEAFVQPLYVPTPHIHFTFGNRLVSPEDGRDMWWQLSASQNPDLMVDEVLRIIRTQALPFLDRFGSAERLASWPVLGESPVNEHVAEAVAYSAALSGDTDLSLSVLDRALLQIDSDPDPVKWRIDIAMRMRMIRTRLGDHSQLAVLLGEWKSTTIAALKLG